MNISGARHGQSCELLDLALYLLYWNIHLKLHNLSKKLSRPRGFPVKSIVAERIGMFKNGSGKVLTCCLP